MIRSKLGGVYMPYSYAPFNIFKPWDNYTNNVCIEFVLSNLEMNLYCKNEYQRRLEAKSFLLSIYTGYLNPIIVRYYKKAIKVFQKFNLLTGLEPFVEMKQKRNNKYNVHVYSKFQGRFLKIHEFQCVSDREYRSKIDKSLFFYIKELLD